MISELLNICKEISHQNSGIDDMNYWDRLKYLNIFSLERRRERYIVLYTFKIILGIVPNPGISWHHSPRRGLLVDVPFIQNNNGFGGNLKHKSFFCTAARLFNCLPQNLRNMSCGINSIKLNLDKFLKNIPDEPRLIGYTQYSCAMSNSICHQIMLLNR